MEVVREVKHFLLESKPNYKKYHRLMETKGNHEHVVIQEIRKNLMYCNKIKNIRTIPNDFWL